MASVIADCHASGTVAAVAWAANDHGELALCGHCLHTQRHHLTAHGWIIMPIRAAHTTTAGVGTEATGQHYALQGD